MASMLALMCIVCLTAQQVIADTHTTCSPDPQHTTVSAVLQVSSADVEARQETSFTLRSASSAQPILNTTQSCSGNADHASDVVEILRSLQQTVEELKTVVAELCTKAPCAADATDSPVEEVTTTLTEVTTTAPPTTAAPECHNFTISYHSYNYKFAALPRSSDGGVLVRFAVRANNDAHIALTGQNADSAFMYEIVIGGWGDTRSVIRRRKQGANLATVPSESTGWLDEETFMDFWVSATPGTSTADLTIAVGRGSDTAPFMSYVDSSPLPVTYVGFSLYNSVGEFEFCGLDLVSGS
ncbi:uncharacterized protein LOC119736183 [Patiria miniata]|uniref:Farnesoic acid O-methyl transferase domain-containing protein n=1 Tax=Patiria miniata TaxID=46514 RepID=A0A914AQU8_PATMI|nr:uncharacterized protein LOC119736183 [Patiria miniata]